MNPKYQEPFAAGFDCGGTKTVVTAADLKGEVFDTFTGGAMNINSLPETVVKDNLFELLQELKRRSGSNSFPETLQSLCFGIAGASNPHTQQVLSEVLHSAGFTRKWYMIGDYQAFLYGAHGSMGGMILISGTGSVAYGEKQVFAADGTSGMISRRAGGWGHLIDDEGSAYAIGRGVLSAVVQAEDGRIPPSVMRMEVMDTLQIDSVAQLIEYVYSPKTGKREIAGLAPLVMKGYEAGEKAAADILKKASEGLCRMASSVITRLDWKNGPLAFGGSVLTKNSVIAQMTEQQLTEEFPQLRIVAPKYDASTGAALYAVKMENNAENKEEN